jgi:hypothetical protein
MKTAIEWTVLPTNIEARVAANNIETDAHNHAFYFPCHIGALRFLLVRSGVLLSQMTGEISCKCGAYLGSVKGTADGASLKYFRANS